MAIPIVLQINSTLNWGSTGRIAEQIAILAETRGFKCYIAHGARFINKSSIETIKIGTKFGNYVHAFLGEYFGRHGFGSKIATYLLIKRLKKIKPDIIHLHNIHGYYINIEILLKYLAKSKIPVVWTLHDCWAFTGHCAHFALANCQKWQDKCNHCPLTMAQYKSRLFDRSNSNFEAKKRLYSYLENVTLVPVSNWLSTFLYKSIMKKFAYKVIHNGIDLNLFKPTYGNLRYRLGIPKEKSIILGIVSTGFNNEKGRREFIELSNNNDYQVVLVGLSRADNENLPSTIMSVGRTHNQQELAEYYTIADVFLNPTYNDTFPTTNLEALACGTPVVTYQTGGSPESLDNQTGIVVPQGDFILLQKAINEVVSNGKNYYSKYCRLRAEKLFNKNERYMDYINLYMSILNNSN